MLVMTPRRVWGAILCLGIVGLIWLAIRPDAVTPTKADEHQPGIPKLSFPPGIADNFPDKDQGEPHVLGDHGPSPRASDRPLTTAGGSGGGGGGGEKPNVPGTQDPPRGASVIPFLDDVRFAMAGPGYKGGVTADGDLRLSFRGAPFFYEFDSISVGGRTVAAAGKSPAIETKDPRTIHISRGSSVTEVYENLGTGVEQSFLVDRPLGASGQDLVVRGKILDAIPPDRTDSKEGFAFGNLVKIGKTTVIDAAGRETLARMKIRGRELAYQVDGAWLADASYPICIDPYISPNFQITIDAKDDRKPAAVYNSIRAEWAIAYDYVFGANDHDIWLALVNAADFSVISRVAIRQSTVTEYDPTLAWSSTTRQYFFCFAYGNGPDLVATHTDELGTVTVAAYYVHDATGNDYVKTPSAVWDSVNNRYAVFFSGEIGTDTTAKIYVKGLNTDGTTWKALTLVRDGGAAHLINPQGIWIPNRGSGEYFCIWESTVCDIFGGFINSGLTAFTSSILTLINQAGADKIPQVAYAEEQKILLVVDESNFSGVDKIYGQYVNAADATLVGSNFAIIEDATKDSQSPNVAASIEMQGQFVVTSEQEVAVGGARDIRAREVNVCGSFLGATYTVTESNNPNANEYYPVAVSRSGTPEVGIFWQDGRNGTDFNLWGAKIGLRPDFPLEPPRDVRWAGHQVLAHSGELSWSWALTSIPGRPSAGHLPFYFEITHRARNVESSGDLGFGWRHNYEEWLDNIAGGKLTFHRGNGRDDVFTLNGSTYEPPPGFYETITYDAPSDTYTCSSRYGISKKFQLRNGVYRLTEIKSRKNVLTITYTAAGDIDFITDSRSKVIDFVTNGSGQITSITDFASRAWVFGFTSGNLTSVRTPTTTEHPSGRTTAFAYTSGGAFAWQNNRLDTVTDPKGQLYLDITYKGEKVSSQRFGDVPDVYTLTYGRCKTTEVDPDGDTVTMTFSATDNTITKREVFTRGLRVGEPANYVETFAHNGQTETSNVTLPRGNAVLLTFDTANPDFKKKGNLLEVRQDSHIVGEPDIVNTMVYEGANQQIRTLTDADGFAWNWRYDTDEATEGDLNGDGITNQDAGALVRFTAPTVNLGQPSPQTILVQFRNNNNGQRIRTIHPGGRQDAYNYYAAPSSSEGWLQAMVVDDLNLDLTETFAYTTFGDVSSYTDRRGNTWTLTVNELSEITQQQAPGPLSYLTKHTRDLDGNITLSEIENKDENGVQDSSLPWIQITRTFDILDAVLSEAVTITSTQTATTTYDYTKTRQLKTVTFPELNKVRFEYDERKLSFKVRKGFGSVDEQVWTKNYDTNGNPSTTVDPGSHTITYGWNGYDWNNKITDALGHYSEAIYNNRGLVTQANRKDSLNVLLTRADLFYDEAGRTWKQEGMFKDSLGVEVGDGLSRSTVLYNSDSLPTKLTNDNVHEFRTSYDTALRANHFEDHLATTGTRIDLTLDGNGNVTQRVSSEYNERTGLVTTYRTDAVYDVINRMTSQTRDPLGLALQTQYFPDSIDFTRKVIDAEGVVTAMTRDGLGRLLETNRDPTGLAIKTTKAWDKNSRLTSDKDPNDNVTSYAYDQQNRLRTTTFADLTTQVLTYSECAILATKTDQSGNVFTLTRDANHLVTQLDITRGVGVIGETQRKFGYDGAYRQTFAENYDGATRISRCDFAYDTLSQPEKETLTIGTFAARTTSRRFDGVGNMTQIAYPGGRTIDRLFDNNERLDQVKDGAETLASFDYEGYAVAKRLFANNIAKKTTWDGAKRITQVENVNDVTSALVSRYNYARLKTGEIKYEDHAHLGKGQAYRYDKVYRNDGAKHGVPSADFSPTKAYTDYTTFTSQRTYDFDKVANRKSKTTDGVTKYYNGNPYVPSNVNEIKSYDGTNWTHDENGNRSDDGVVTVKVNAWDLPIEIRKKSDGSLVATYTYDAHKRRVKTDVVGGTVTLWYYSGWQIVEERNASETVTGTHVYGDEYIDCVLTSTRSGTRYWYHENWLYSIGHVTNNSGGIVERYEYDERGVPSFFTGPGADTVWNTSDDVTATASAISNFHLFQGRQYDNWGPAGSQWYQYRHRMYDPVHGKFVSRDPIGTWGDPSQLGNAYGFVGANAVNGLDPFGLRGMWPGAETAFYLALRDKDVNAAQEFAHAVAAAKEEEKVVSFNGQWMPESRRDAQWSRALAEALDAVRESKVLRFSAFTRTPFVPFAPIGLVAVIDATISGISRAGDPEATRIPLVEELDCGSLVLLVLWKALRDIYQGHLDEIKSSAFYPFGIHANFLFSLFIYNIDTPAEATDPSNRLLPFQRCGDSNPRRGDIFVGYEPEEDPGAELQAGMAEGPCTAYAPMGNEDPGPCQYRNTIDYLEGRYENHAWFRFSIEAFERDILGWSVPDPYAAPPAKGSAGSRSKED